MSGASRSSMMAHALYVTTCGRMAAEREKQSRALSVLPFFTSSVPSVCSSEKSSGKSSVASVSSAMAVSRFPALASTDAHVLKSDPWPCPARLACFFDSFRISTARSLFPFFISRCASATVASVKSGPPSAMARCSSSVAFSQSPKFSSSSLAHATRILGVFCAQSRSASWKVARACSTWPVSTSSSARAMYTCGIGGVVGWGGVVSGGRWMDGWMQGAISRHVACIKNA